MPMHKINRIRNLAAEIAEENARMREVVACAQEVLKATPPDTFLGRQHHGILPLISEREQALQELNFMQWRADALL